MLLCYFENGIAQDSHPATRSSSRFHCLVVINLYVHNQICWDLARTSTSTIIVSQLLTRQESSIPRVRPRKSLQSRSSPLTNFCPPALSVWVRRYDGSWWCSESSFVELEHGISTACFTNRRRRGHRIGEKEVQCELRIHLTGSNEFCRLAAVKLFD